MPLNLPDRLPAIDLLKEEKIKLPVIADGTPDWIYMGEYMRMRMESAKTDLVNMQSAL